MALKQKIAVEAYTEARSSLAKLRADLQQAKDDLQVKQVVLDALKKAAVGESPDAQAASAAYPILTQLTDQAEEIEKRLTTIRNSVKESDDNKKVLEELASLQKAIEGKLAKRRKELAEKSQNANQLNRIPRSSNSTPASTSSLPMRRQRQMTLKRHGRRPNGSAIPRSTWK